MGEGSKTVSALVEHGRRDEERDIELQTFFDVMFCRQSRHIYQVDIQMLDRRKQMRIEDEGGHMTYTAYLTHGPNATCHLLMRSQKLGESDEGLNAGAFRLGTYIGEYR
jgi:hypothetical protein